MSTTPPVELKAPDISRWAAGNTGTAYVWSFDSGQPGPHVMVQALTHGNEICGALALDWLLGQQAHWQVPQGRLTLAFGNLEAFARWDPQDPDRSRYVDEDFNRVWADDALFGARDSIELRRARELQPFVDAADLLLDMHSMREPCKPLMVCGASGRGGEKGAALARRLGVPEVLLIDTGHPAGLRMIERGAFGDPAAARTALLIECGQHWERDAEVVALDTLLRFLGHSGALPAGFVRTHLQRFGRCAAGAPATGARHRSGGRAQPGLPLRARVPWPGGAGQGRRADRHRWRPDHHRALRPDGAGDARRDAPEGGGDDGAAGADRRLRRAAHRGVCSGSPTTASRPGCALRSCSVPPCAWATSRHRYSPSPTPPVRRSRAASAR